MIRNNQNGRRRGRGGARPPQAGGGPSGNYGNNGGSNRVDVRQRGNATQLLEKYKALARDAAQGGDRVQTEFYMQYADHYYRVLNEFRARDPQPAPRPYDDDDGEPQNYSNAGGNQNYAPQNYAPPQADGRYADEADDDGDDYAPPQRQSAPNGERQSAERPNGDRPNGERQGGERLRANYDQQPRTPRPQNPPREQPPRYAGNRSDSEVRPPRDEPRYNGNGREGRTAETYVAPPVADPVRDEPIAAVEAVASIPGLPGPATVAATPVADAPAAETEAPAPRRRGRPRKVVPVVTDGADA